MDVEVWETYGVRRPRVSQQREPGLQDMSDGRCGLTVGLRRRTNAPRAPTILGGRRRSSLCRCMLSACPGTKWQKEGLDAKGVVTTANSSPRDGPTWRDPGMSLGRCHSSDRTDTRPRPAIRWIIVRHACTTSQHRTRSGLLDPTLPLIRGRCRKVHVLTVRG